MALTDTARTVLVLVSGCARAAEHPILKLRELVDGVLREMCGLFEARYAKTGRPSIPPERLLRASLLHVVYSVKERASVDGAVGLQLAVPLVCRLQHR